MQAPCGRAFSHFSISFSPSFAYLVPELPVHLCPSKAAYQPM